MKIAIAKSLVSSWVSLLVLLSLILNPVLAANVCKMAVADSAATAVLAEPDSAALAALPACHRQMAMAAMTAGMANNMATSQQAADLEPAKALPADAAECAADFCAALCDALAAAAMSQAAPAALAVADAVVRIADAPAHDGLIERRLELLLRPPIA